MALRLGTSTPFSDSFWRANESPHHGDWQG